MKRNVIHRKVAEHKFDRKVALCTNEILAEDDDNNRLSDLAVRTGLSTLAAHRS
jgi:hypothetical protein